MNFTTEQSSTVCEAAHGLLAICERKLKTDAKTEHVINMWVSVTWITLNNTSDQDQTCTDTIVDVS